MSHIPKMTLLGQYQYHNDLFVNLTLPTGITKETFIDTLLARYGEAPVIYPNPDYMKWYFGMWSRKWSDDLKRIAEAITAEYNPLHNYDRYEEYKDTESTSNSLKTSGTTEDQVSAYNSNSYQPDNKQINAGNSDGNEDRELEHTAHLYGNIGVTTSQQMLEAELELRQKLNLYEIVTGLLAKEVCVLVY